MTSSGTKDYAPPSQDEVEVSLFGPGYGECVVIHAADNDWIIVDSCRNPDTQEPIAISYLNAIRVNPATNIRAVIATHWDDDHTAGLSEVYHKARAAKVVFSSALLSDQFLSVVANWRLRKYLPFGSGIDEFDAILTELAGRAQFSNNPTPVLASHNKVVWEKSGAELRALSPSDAGLAAATMRFTEIFANRPALSRRVPKIDGNHSSVALLLRVKGISTLLGADLQVRADRSHGWFAIVDQFTGDKSTCYKIPHHGSENGDHEEIWDKLLVPSPAACTTPFVKGNHRLPSENDCRRILRRTQRAYLSAPPAPRKVRLKNLTAEKMLRQFSLRSQFVPGRFGHVRMRCKIGSASWETELFGDAVPLDSLLQRSAQIWS